MSRRIVRIRKKHISIDNIKNYRTEKFSIGLAVPITSRKRDYKVVQDTDFFKLLLKSFVKTYDKTKKYSYNFYLGYDDDDPFFTKNKEEMVSQFNKLVTDNCKLHMVMVENLKGKVGEIWSRLAELASKENDYIYQIGDDIRMISERWEDIFIENLRRRNNTGAVGPWDTFHDDGRILTQSFVHVTHLQIFGDYYPKEIKNWHIDDWISEIYQAKPLEFVKVKNSGGEPRYKVVDDVENYKSVFKRTLPIFEKYKKTLELEVVYVKSPKELHFVHDNRRFVCSNRLVKWDYEIDDCIDMKEKIILMIPRTVIRKKINTDFFDEKIHFITYGSGPYEKSKRRLVDEARNFYQFKTVTDYGRNDIDSDFIQKTKGVVNLPRGGGYWIWKAHFILKKLNEIDQDEYLIYADAGCTLNHHGFDRFKEYIHMLDTSDTPIIGFQMPHKERNWTTDKIFEYFNLSPESEIGESGQIIATIQIMKKCDYTVKLFQKMLEVITEDPFLFTDKYNKETKRNDFKDNRHDQSILSILKKIHGCIILEDETYFEIFGKGKSLKYPIWATRRNY